VTSPSREDARVDSVADSIHDDIGPFRKVVRIEMAVRIGERRSHRLSA
jgi:hypothetical protein